MNSSILELGNTTGLPCYQLQGFGPTAGNASCGDARDSFDFTLQFEQSILSIGPSALFLLAFPLRWLHLRSQSRKTTKGGLLSVSKVGCIVVLGILQLVLLVLWARISRHGGASGGVAIAANTIGVLNAIALCVLSFAEHRQSIRPSSLITLYLLSSIAFDAVQCRTLWLLPERHDLRTVATIFSISIGLKLGILVLEVIEKRTFLLPPWNRAPPESLSGTINRSLFWWLNALFKRGYNGVLNPESLWPTDQSMDSERLLLRLRSVWSTTKDKRKKNALAFSVVKSIKWPVVAVFFPRLCLIGLRFSQPLLLKRIVDFVSQPDGKEKTNIGYGLLGATALVFLGNAIVKGVFNYKKVRVMTMARGALISIIFSKVLTVSATIAAAKGSRTLTLMSTDVENIAKGFELMNDIWASPIEVAIALWLLQRELGVAFVIPALMAAVCTLVMFRISPLIGRAFAAWNKGIQERVSLTSSILGNMKEVKLLGLTERWAAEIQNQRVKELELSKKARILSVYRLVIIRISTFLTPAVTFGVFIAVSKRSGGSFSVSTAFTSLSLLSLLGSPLSLMFTALPQLSMALACFARIQDFLVEDDKDDGKAISTPQLESILTQALKSDLASDREGQSSAVYSKNGIELDNLTPLNTQTDRSHDPVLRLDNAAFGVKEAGAPITHSLNMKVHRSSLTMLIGRVGSGKSTLLKGLIGELPLSAGSIHTAVTESAYCEQQPWLFNDSIQNNILGHSALEAKWYETVIKSCALDKDFATLPLGGLTLVGSKGISLSGGQKARVALARAIYSRKEVAVIDDMLSGLDRSTEEFIWTNVFGPRGLFRQHGVTVILATHAVRHLREANKIVVLGGSGTIVEQGTFQSLDFQNGYLQNLIVDSQIKGSQTSKVSDIVEETNNNLSTAAAKNPETEDDLLRKTGDTTLYKYYLKSVGWKDSLTILALTICAQFCVSFPQLWIKFWTEADSRHPGDRTGMFYGVYVMFGVVGLIMTYWCIVYSWIVITPKSGAYLHQKLVDVIMGAPLSFFVTTDTGVTVNRFSQDMSLLDIGLSPGACLTLFSLTAVVFGMILIMISLKYMAAILPFAAAFLYGLQLFYLQTSRQLRYMDLEAKSPLYTHLLETIQGLSSIRSFGWSSATLSDSMKYLDVSQRPFYLLYCIQQWLQLVLDLFASGMAVLFVGIALSTSSASAGAIGLALLNILTLNQSLVTVIVEWTELETSLGAVARLRNMEMNTPREAQDCETFIPGESWPQSGSVQFNNIEASYGSDSDPVLRNISFQIEAGQKVAICGRTGSGKSSLLLTLFGLLDLRSGSITIDSLTTATLPRSVLRSHLNVIPQDPVIFPGSVRLNAVPSESSPLSSEDDKIIAALTTVNLWDIIASRGGLDADMSTIPLSQGQKQLFCLARALLRRDKSPILVLDEATSNLDHHTDDLMQKIIREEWKGKTVIAVVHRLNTVMDFDKIVVLERGVLVEFDDPETLLEREGGVFRALWDSQI
ncbi:ABC transporter FUM19 [Lachnellula suecica]|uniref:ABC transporter FUM19 n=1 Tax=Lachnellula suecica TaxID=602035 RepID=A0A8T9BU91_9HELO|nr:ABC transporter FUM19 [Lachnellula suecica]